MPATGRLGILTTGKLGTLTTGRPEKLTTGRPGILTTGRPGILITGKPGTLSTGELGTLSTGETCRKAVPQHSAFSQWSQEDPAPSYWKGNSYQEEASRDQSPRTWGQSPPHRCCTVTRGRR